MKNCKLTITWALILFSLTQLSCRKEWLDVKANIFQTVPSSLTDFQALMDNGTNELNYWAPGLQEIASDGHHSTDAAWQSADDITKNAYTWTHNFAYANVDDWTQPYSKIFYCNLTLDGLQKIVPASNSDQQILNNIKGQALFIRAYTFFDLAQVWAPPLDSSTYDKDLSVPLRLSSDITLPSIRSTVHQTYDQILDDLKSSANLLSSMEVYLRPTVKAAYACLARVYLSIGSYDSAWNYSNKCLNIDDNLLDYNSLDASVGNIGYLNKEVLFQTTINSGLYSGFLTNNCLIDSSLFELYDTNDLRRSLFFIVNSDSSISFQGNYNNNPNLFSGFATDEQYLIRAECGARKGDVISSIADLNTLLQNRWKSGTFVPLTTSNTDSALVQIITERKKELLLRGILWQDLRRLNKDARFKTIISRTINGNTYTLVPNSYEYTFPIPDDIIHLSGIMQNPGW